ncbi:DUF4381 domain-containing protein [Pseudomonas koreensis]|uniref:DUF4381 domain-containing protein n=1 Tax=Pseudomonas koreensis TaxID=198620 RepID=UPI0021C9690A|nr:DUF4381 domain-containing protein [Pseudomonas koreensis]MCU0093764.1 DUF4381 domain-containing protein [Pseudomonas koreensis]
MNPNVPDIGQLKELGLPAPVSYAPQTWGWWVLLAVLVLAALLIGVRRYRQWRRDQYRREALVRLAQLRERSDDLNALRELPELLKRVALSMPASTSVAALSEEDWQRFLQQHSKKPLPADFSQQLAQLAYAPDDILRALPAPQRLALFDTCQHWVERHHVAA